MILEECKINLPTIIPNGGESPVIDLFITGKYSVPFNQGPDLEGMFYFNEDHDGILLSETNQNWKQAFSKPYLDLHQIVLKGFLSPDSQFIDTFSLTALSVIGKYCLTE